MMKSKSKLKSDKPAQDVQSGKFDKSKPLKEGKIEDFKFTPPAPPKSKK